MSHAQRGDRIADAIFIIAAGRVVAIGGTIGGGIILTVQGGADLQSGHDDMAGTVIDASGVVVSRSASVRRIDSIAIVECRREIVGHRQRQGGIGTDNQVVCHLPARDATVRLGTERDSPGSVVESTCRGGNRQRRRLNVALMDREECLQLSVDGHLQSRARECGLQRVCDRAVERRGPGRVCRESARDGVERPDGHFTST